MQAAANVNRESQERSVLAYWPFLLLGTFFGFVLIRSEVVSWYHIQEMFRFQSFHMYGVIGSAVIVGAISTWLIKRSGIRTIDGQDIVVPAKDRRLPHLVLGGVIFGLGWGLGGACPGPVYALMGSGFPGVLVLFLGMLVGTFAYGVLQSRLPH